MPVTSDNREPVQGTPWVWWDITHSVLVERLEESRNPTVAIELDDGMYVLSLWVKWSSPPSVGDVHYGFYLEVE